mmetsp:Transcript_44040/g.60145  ORF Transcript_44040/g.60145 Transcript_44040/m.60145 type:complete len:101 (-) Transcript_44040:237-539(-)
METNRALFAYVLKSQNTKTTATGTCLITHTHHQSNRNTKNSFVRTNASKSIEQCDRARFFFYECAECFTPQTIPSKDADTSVCIENAIAAMNADYLAAWT